MNFEGQEIPPERIRELADLLEPETLDKMRSGIPVDPEQAIAAIAYMEMNPPKPLPWYKRLWQKMWRGY